MHLLVHDPDATKLEPEPQPIAQYLVMIAQDVVHPGAPLGLGQYPAYHVAVALRPVDLLGQLPGIHDVAHEIQSLAVILF
jgi:hypothetical protein